MAKLIYTCNYDGNVCNREISTDDDLTELWDEMYSYCGITNLPTGKGTWEWQTGQENRIFCKNCPYHYCSTGGGTCQRGGQCYEGGWIRKAIA